MPLLIPLLPRRAWGWGRGEDHNHREEVL